MSWTCSTFLFIPVFEKFLADYIKEYGTICTEVEGKLQQHYLTKVKTVDAKVDMVMKYVQLDFKNKARRSLLRKSDNKLFLDKTIFDACTFCKHLQLRKLWKFQGAGQLTDKDRKQIWAKLKGLWLLAQAPLLLPTEVCTKMESIAKERSNTFQQDTFDIEPVKAECKQLIYKVKGPHFQKILEWAEELTLSKHTPIIDLLPEQYAKTASRLQNIMRDAEYRELLSETITPILSSVKTGASKSGIKWQDEKEEEEEEEETKDTEHKAVPNDSEDEYDYENPEYASIKSDFEASAEDRQKVDFVIDMLFSVLQKHGGDLRDVVNNPEKLVHVVSNIGQIKNITATLTQDIDNVATKMASGAGAPGALATPSTKVIITPPSGPAGGANLKAPPK